jgi:transposase-like protein
MSYKGQKYESYSEELKKRAIEMRLQGMTKAAVAKTLGIKDIGRLKVWMRKYKMQGEFGLVDSRGRPKTYVDQERYVKRLEMENAVLKKWLAITKGEVYLSSIASSKSCGNTTPLTCSASNSVYPEADSTLTWITSMKIRIARWLRQRTIAMMADTDIVSSSYLSCRIMMYG